MAELVGRATIRVDMDTTAATQAVRQFTTRARTQLRTAERSVTAVTTQLRTLRTTAQNVTVTINVQGRDDITSAARAMQDLRGDAATASTGLGALTTRSAATAAALQLLDNAATSAARAIHVLAGRATVATAALTTFRLAVSAAATALGRLAGRAEAARDRLGDLGTAALSASVSIDGLGDSTRGVNDNLRDLRGNLPNISRAMRDTTDAAGGGGGGLVGALGSIAALSGAAAAGLGSIIPLAAGLAAAVGQIAPAAGVAATGMLAVQLASGALKLGMVGVGDAMSAALDPSKAAEFEEALAKLAPSARAFALEVKALAPEFKKLQQGVQERLFKGMDDVLRDMGKATLPVLRKGLVDAAGALNAMGKGVGTAAVNLSKDGTLGQAVGSANAGLSNLSRVPGQVVTGLTQIAAAAGPSFERLTGSAGKAFDGISKKIAGAFESGAMERAIEKALDLAKQLGQGLGNVGRIIGNVFGAAEQSGSGLITNFRDITASLAELTAQADVQSGLRALFQTMGTVGRTAVALFGEAVKGIAPVITALGPPVQTLVKSLGSALTPVIRSLSPILVSLATNAGRLVTAFAPLLVVAGQLVSGALDALAPILDGLAEQAALLAESVMGHLGPSLQGLPGIINPVIEFGGKLLSLWLRLQNAVLEALLPAIKRLGEGFGALVRAGGELLGAFTGAEGGARGLGGAVRPVIGLVGDLALKVADLVASGLERLAAWAAAHRLELMQVFNAGKSAVAGFALAVVENMPFAFAMFRTLATVVLDAFGVIINGAAGAFGWIPGIGPKIKGAASAFNTFSRLAKEGMDKAGREIAEFSAEATPKLRQNVLEVDISNWKSQIAEAKRQISDKNLPPKKRATLTANIADWKAKVAQAERQLKAVKATKQAKLTANIADWRAKVANAERQLKTAQGSKKATLTANINDWRRKIGSAQQQINNLPRSRSTTLNITTRRHYINITENRVINTGRGGRGPNAGGATGGLYTGSGFKHRGYAHGGLVDGPGTETSDSIWGGPWLSKNEFVVNARRTRQHLPLLKAINEGRLAALNSMRIPPATIPTPAVSSMRNGSRAPATTPAEVHLHVHNHGVIGSQIEVDNWLARSLENLGHTGRLPAAIGGR